MRPEDQIRKRLYDRMILEWGFPKGLIAIEKEIGTLPHAPKECMGRRLDLICFAPDIHPQYSLYPLLLVECKAVALNEEAERQVFGYNEIVRAPFVCLANQTEMKTIWWERRKVCSVPFIPVYSELVRNALSVWIQ